MKIPCPCGNPQSYAHCCEVYIEGHAPAPTPEALMRSRYAAYVLAKVTYLKKTMKGIPFDEADTSNWLKEVTWEGLQVIETRIKAEKLGFVSFIARYTYQGKKQAICEKSEFHKIGEQWLYVGGKALNPNKQWQKGTT